MKECADLGVDAHQEQRTYWNLPRYSHQDASSVPPGQPDYPDDVGQFVEGATVRVIVNAYERNAKARAACLAHHGLSCAICNITFEVAYGPIGEGFMHVHHLVPISSNRVEHPVDPIADLRPVCPNCHAMLHRSNPPFSIAEMVEIRAAAQLTVIR